MLNFIVNTAAPHTQLVHYWEKCVGSCHAYTALRADWQEQMKKVHHDMGFEYVRFHGIFDDDMSVVVKNRETGELRYCFVNIDLIFDFLLSIGMKPFIEIGFMPTVFASTETTCFHYKGNVSPPKDYGVWETFIKTFVEHLVDRYGLDEVRSWFFEVWNEPNLVYFFDGKKEDYFKLYGHTVKAIKQVDSLLTVGGPATAINGWIPDLINYCKENEVPLDFISTHHYPTDDPLWRNSDLDLEELFKTLTSDSQKKYERGILKKMVLKARSEASKLPLYYTEWNSSAILPDEIHDIPYTAAFVAKAVIDNIGIIDGYSYWTFSDIFEEGAQLPGEFHGGFGMQTIHGIPKPVYHTFAFLHKLGTQQLLVTKEQETVGIIATTSKVGNEISILAYNHNVLDAEIKQQAVEIKFSGRAIDGAQISVVDDEHANAYAAWKEMGSPTYPNDVQLQKLSEAGMVTKESLGVIVNGSECSIKFELLPHAICFIKVH